MKLLSALMAGAMAIACTMPADADERDRRSRKARSADHESARYRGRSSTVDHRGLCQRDNGRPLDSLRLNHECDRQEFWARFNDLGGDGRR